MADGTFTNLFADFNKRIRQRIAVQPLKKEDTTEGNPIFTADSFRGITDPLAILVRKIFIARNVTDESFNERHRSWGIRQGHGARDINTHRNNLRKTLSRPKISMGQFLKVIGSVLDLRLAQIDVTVLDPKTGERTVYTYNPPQTLPPPRK